MKRFTSHSQNLLKSPRLVRELIGHSTIRRADTVLDIGAGSGIITSALATKCRNVIAYELDPRMVAKIRENTAEFTNVRIIEKDFLNTELPASAYKVFANIPFHLSSPILRKLTEADNPPEGIYLIVQRQFAKKLIIDEDHFTGQLGAMVAPQFTVRIRRKLERTDYWPHPAVDTVLVELLLREEPLIARDRMPAYRQFIADCFSTTKIFQSMPVTSISTRKDVKPSELSAAQWVELFTGQKKY
jgi:23S rRNA (adenine-N6)-dimethyltransferase